MTTIDPATLESLYREACRNSALAGIYADALEEVGKLEAAALARFGYVREARTLFRDRPEEEWLIGIHQEAGRFLIDSGESPDTAEFFIGNFHGSEENRESPDLIAEKRIYRVESISGLLLRIYRKRTPQP